MGTLQFYLNDSLIPFDGSHNTVKVDAIRNQQNLKGTTVACREGDCGACSLLVGTWHAQDQRVRYESVISCISPVVNFHGRHVVTIEGLVGTQGGHPFQEAFRKTGASQCGFCTPGFLISLACALINEFPKFDPDSVFAYFDGNICRCTGYKSIERAVREILRDLGSQEPAGDALGFLMGKGILPPFFAGVGEKLAALQRPKGNTPKMSESCRVLGGGSDLFVQIPDHMPDQVCMPMKANAMEQNIYKEGDHLWVFAGTHVEEFRRSPLVAQVVPHMFELLRLFASLPIRNIATIGGNVVNASPIGDLTALLLALDSGCLLTSEAGERTVKLENFYLGYKQKDLREGEWLKALLIPIPAGGAKAHFEKISKRRYLDIASVNSGCLLVVDGDLRVSHARISAGGVAPIPLMLKKTAAALAGQRVGIATLEKVLEVAQTEIAPISDVRGTAQYKRQALGQLLAAHFLTLFPGAMAAQEVAGLLKQTMTKEASRGLFY